MKPFKRQFTTAHLLWKLWRPRSHVLWLRQSQRRARTWRWHRVAGTWSLEDDFWERLGKHIYGEASIVDITCFNWTVICTLHAWCLVPFNIHLSCLGQTGFCLLLIIPYGEMERRPERSRSPPPRAAPGTPPGPPPRTPPDDVMLRVPMTPPELLGSPPGTPDSVWICSYMLMTWIQVVIRQATKETAWQILVFPTPVCLSHLFCQCIIAIGVVHFEQQWKRSLVDVVKCSVSSVVSMLRADNLLPRWEGALCPHCRRGTMGTLQSYAGVPKHRCNHWKCLKRINPHHAHPIFVEGIVHTGCHAHAAFEQCRTCGNPPPASNQSQGHWRHAEAPLPAPGLLGPQKGEGNYLWQVSAVGRCGSRWGYLWQNGQRWVGGVGTMVRHHSTRPTLYFGTSPPYTPSHGQGQSSRPRCRAKSWMETACEEMAAGSSNHSTHRLGQELQAQGTWCPAWSCRT